MWLLRLQKITSGLLIFFLLFSFTIRIPLLTFFSAQSYAAQEEFYNLVSIIVDEDTYNETKTKLVRYSRDIQATLEDTRVVILPTPNDASVLDIASLNEKLFFEGYKGVKDVNFESRLVGTVLVGKIPVPVVFDEANSSRSILPFVDFEDKAYIFNEASEKYEKSDAAETRLVPEIWHGVISPNTGDQESDIQAIKDYFDKNHDFYTGQGVFDQDKGVIDGKDTDASAGYEPYVFYYDQFRENSALQYQKYVGYQMYLQNMEDITYKRYSKDLAEKVKNQVLGNQNQDIQDLLIQVDPDFDMSAFNKGGIDVNSSSDIITRYITDNSTKKFLEIFNGSSLGEMRKSVYNAGRYNKSGSKVNVDMPPFLISVLDQVSAEIVKNVNNSLEKEIINLVENGLSQKIAIPLISNGGLAGGGEAGSCKSLSRNFYFGKIANNITEAKDCSIYRGSTLSGTLVEANRGYNINLVQEDLSLCQTSLASGVENASKGYWGGNTPLNFDTPVNGGYGDFKLKTHDVKGGIRPVFDILGSKQVEDESKIPSPLDCLSQGTFIMTYKEKSETRGSGEHEREVCVLDFQAPVLGKARAGAWSCNTSNIQSQSGISFIGELQKIANHNIGSCVVRTLKLNGDVFKQETVEQSCHGSGENESCSCPANQGTTEFKAISSYILHTSPTNEEFGAQINSLFTPSLPIDTNRYIDFIGARGGTQEEEYGYRRIDFPKLFRIQAEQGEELSLALIDQKLKKHLEEVSEQINIVIRSSDPSDLLGLELEVYNALKTGEYPEDSFDLYTFLQEKPLEVFTIDNQSKEISYYDTLVFAIYWNNLNTVSSKYKFIFENYLSNEFKGNEYQFHLPRAKKIYETSYLAAPGDAQNMYIKLDPEMKGVHPYADILSKNLELQSVLMASSVATPYTPDGAFECAPPDGVPIWQWIPAVVCWLSNMLPPTISPPSQGSCGDRTLFLDDEEKEELLVCEGDVNKNGINDCIEGKLTGGSILLTSDAGRYYYNSPGTLGAQLKDKNGEIIRFDNVSYISHNLEKVEIPLESDEVFSGSNKKTIYDASIPSLSTPEALEEAKRYVGFNSVKLRVQAGETKAYFYGKGSDANIYFSAKLQAIDSQGNIAIDLESNIQKIQIRGDRMFLESFIVDPEGESSPNNTIGASADQNIFLIDESQISRVNAQEELQNISPDSEKLLLSLHNYSLAGNVLDINYPLSIDLVYEGKTVLSQKDISKNQFSGVYQVFSTSKSGRYEIQVTDATGFKSYRRLEILPDVAQDMNAVMSTNLVETGGNISTHLLTILDAFDNPASAEIYTVEMSLEGGGLVFDTNTQDTISYNIVEGYKAFRLRSTDIEGDNTLAITLKNILGETISQTTKHIRTIDTIALKVDTLGDEAKVGGGNYDYALSFTDINGNILTDLNSRVYLIVPKLYGRALQAYIDVKNGKAQVSFQTATLAAQNIALEFQLEGGNKIYKQYIDILPESPIKVDLHLNKDKIEANKDESAILQAVLKDRYNNDVFTDSSTQLHIEVAAQSQQVISIGEDSKIVKEGKTQFEISASDIPGIGYFKVSSDPDLGNNSFDLIGQAPFESSRLIIPTMKKASGALTSEGKHFFKIFTGTKLISKFSTKQTLQASEAYKNLTSVLQEQIIDFWEETNSLEVSGIGENAGSVETFFFWDKKDITGNAYNGMYSVLLGAPYGDISKENYLAGALLFDRDNSSLAVSSLLNNPYTFSDVFSLEKNGLLRSVGSGDITQDIQFSPDFDEEGRLTIDVSNAALENYIGKIYYNISQSSDISLRVDETLGYSVELIGQDAIVKNANGKKVFIAYEAGRFERKSGTYVEIDSSYVGKGIQLFLKNGEDIIGTMKISGEFNTNITRNENILTNKLATLQDTLVVYLHSSQYSTREKFSGQEDSLLRFYYQDPFADRYSLDTFHNTDITGLESSYDQAGIGWKDSNTMLLSFSAGESVGEATKNFQSFSLINLGDPVISLKPLTYTFPKDGSQEKSFDPTVGRLIEDQENLIGYQVFDYNNDAAQDVLTIQSDGYLKLFENVPTQGRLLEQRNLVYAADGGSVRLVKTGDFTGDGYGDIFFVSETGKPELFNNVEKDFIRHDIASQFSLSGSIIQAETFDMDADGRDDIVTLDDAGEIYIFYGSGTSDAPVFTKKYIGDGYGIKLSDTIISHGGGIYYDDLIQIDPNNAAAILKKNEEYLQDFQEAIDTQTDTPVPEFIDESLVNGFLYVSLPYVPTNYEGKELTDKQILLEGVDQELSVVGGSEQAQDLAIDTIASLSGFLDNYGEYVNYTGFQNSYNIQTYFLRSQYADTQGLEVKKTFSDASPVYLQTGDTVYLDISIKNTSQQRKNNIAYIESLPKFFRFATDTFEVLTQEGTMIPRKSGVGEYDILIDGFYLDPGEETTIRIKLITLPLSYGYMQVGLYEKGELGDDIYGDIILKENEKNCGKKADIYRSTSMRSYEKGTTTPSCEAADIDIGNTFPQLKDTDGDGIPDYLQSLLEVDANGNSVPSSNTGTLTEYADTILEDLGVDTDGDGIPDKDDTMDNTDSATDFMGALDAINGAIDDISEDIDELIQGLSCGFGGGSCFANPLNWAPLAPGNDLTLYGMPIGDGLRVNEGVPIFSAMTGIPTPFGCFPSVFPMSSLAFPSCGGLGAGGSLGANSPGNFVRIFATPTLTGGAGIAVCFGGPATAAGYANPPGLHPIIPGGNCIVAAIPLFGCEGGEGDPGVVGYPYGDQFGIINANCDGGDKKALYTPQEIESAFVQDYLEYLRTGVKTGGLYTTYKEVVKKVSKNGGGGYLLPSEPLISIGGGGENSMGVSVDLDTSALASGNFKDIIKIKNKRIGAFPNFLMGWVERQLDEITSKLTNLPKIFVVLPDFGGIFDFSWKDFGSQMQDSFTQGKAQKAQERDFENTTLEALRTQKSHLDCSGSDRIRCKTIDLQIASQKGRTKLNGAKETLSGIKEVFEFIGNIPLVNVEMETINVNVPWIDPTELNRFITDWSYTLEQWEDELDTAKNSWSLGVACSESTAAEQARCEQENSIKEKAFLDSQAFVSSLATNIQILQEYKEFPDKLAKLINIKEVWLEQILCNIQAIATLLGEWINTNGERFKAWVELYMLIKAVLKSWQLLIDVFTGYEEECKQCKNERQDLQGFIFKLVSAIIPSPPIIQFPKWPDIILDFHNIRAGLTIYMPDFEMNLRPIILPTLPQLHLPKIPSIGFSLPALPALPRFTIPELPDLPTLPTVELPDLPPPPKIPKIFGAVEGILNIIKLVTKIMCILKSSPFVPEWRAGDQIAFLTERNGYLPTDFINIQPPAFSYSMISAIKVTTYVNFEFETEFIIEAVRSITAPLDKMTNNIVNMFNIQLSDISLTEAIPGSINVDIDTDRTIEIEDISLAPLDENPQGALFIATLIAKKSQQLIQYLAQNSKETVGNKEFLAYVGKQLASEKITSDPRTQELQSLWSQVYNLSYSKEDTFIQELKKNSEEKFNTLEGIISTEIQYSKQQQERLKNLGEPELITSVAINTARDRAGEYNTLLEGYNEKILDASIRLVSGESKESQAFKKDIEARGEDIMEQLRGGLQAYSAPRNLLTDSGESGDIPSVNSCNPSGSKYRYEGIYILEYDKNYRLFDYVDSLRGDEKPTVLDIDNDGDDDILYLVKGKLYLKENRKQEATKSYVSTPPLILKASDNIFYNGDVYYEAINGFSENNVSDGAVNVEFQKPTDIDIHNFRMSYHTIVDRYMNEGDDTFIPEQVQTHIVDGVSGVENRLLETQTEDYSISKHLATLTYAGAMNKIKLTTEKLKNIKQDLADNTQVTLTSNTHIYAAGESFNITYTLSDGTSQQVTVPAYRSIYFDRPVAITEIAGDGYISIGILEDITGTDLIDYIGKPLLPGAKISFIGDRQTLDSSSHVDIRYYDDTLLQMDIRDIWSYTLYDLGDNYGSTHTMRLKVPNDFYYARIRSFKDTILGTQSKQILLAPQKYSDTLAPQIGLNQRIRIPVYQSQVVDLTPYIYEDGGLGGIADVRVDTDLSIDSNGDGDSRNDNETQNIEISKNAVRIAIKFGPYDTLFEKNIVISLIDDNGNIGEKELVLEVYSPAPQIESIQEDIISGQIDETLLDEPVRLYRYRGGVIEKLQKASGGDVVDTDAQGNYAFQTRDTAEGLVLTHSGATIAHIDEYTGKINIEAPLTTIRVLASNNPENNSVYPEIQILSSGESVFRQFIKMPEQETRVVSSFDSLTELGSYIKIINQEEYNTFRVPLTAPINPGSVSVYRSDDNSKKAVMTIFKDGRIHIDRSQYRLVYRESGDKISLVFVDATTGLDIAQIIYHLDASYILR